MDTHRFPDIVTIVKFAIWPAAVLCGVLVGLNAARVFGPDTFRAVIRCDTPLAKFATVSDGTNVRRTFMIDSVGGAPLTLTAVKAGCDCTTINPSVFPVVLEPGKSLPLTVSLDTSGKNGEIATTVAVLSSDLNTPRLVLTMRGNVRQLESTNNP